MGLECQFSFEDLFLAAHKRTIRQEEYQDLMQASQPHRNKLVEQWAELSGWVTIPRQGTDGLLYLAFHPPLSERQREDLPS